MNTVTSVRLLKRIYGAKWNGDVVNLDPGLVYIGMGGPSAAREGLEPLGFGKPWDCLRDPRGWQIAYREYLWKKLNADPEFRERVKALRNKTLVCWCKGKRPEHNGNDFCHGDILARAIAWLNGEET